MKKHKYLYLFIFYLLMSLSLTACTQPVEISLEFDSNGGSSVSSLLTDGKSLTLPAEPTKEGYSFEGWFWDNGIFSEPLIESAIEDTYIQDIMVVYAKWDLINYTITYELDGGIVISDNPTTFNVESSSLSITDPNKEGYTFDAFYFDEAMTSPYSFASLPKDNITLYAKWNINSYTLQFLDLDESVIESSLYEYSVDLSDLEVPIPIKEGYVFLGWDIDIPITMPASDVTLYAQWEIGRYTLEFLNRDGTILQTTDYQFGETLDNVSYPIAAFDGYDFVEWDISIPSSMPAHKVTITAQYIINEYTITFESMGGSFVDSITQVFNSAIEKPENPTNDDGSFFVGWFTDQAYTEPFIFDLMPSSDIILYAKWAESFVQGVTDTQILVGNTAATSSYFAVIGVPFNAGIEAYFFQINQAGGINGRTISFIHYDDAYDSTLGMTYTQKLVEEDQVFALVGHFGTPTVSATLDYIQESGIPMVYAATNINELYFHESSGNPIMPVQPIYMTEGRVMTARVLNESLFGVNLDQKLGLSTQIGVLYTSDSIGLSMKQGIELQALEEDRTSSFIYRAFDPDNLSSLNSSILELKSANVGAVIIASNAVPFMVAIESLNSQHMEAPVFTSYMNATPSAIDMNIDYGFNMYFNAWLDFMDPDGVGGFSDDCNDFMSDMTDAGYSEYTTNSYAIAGYIAASVFIEGLLRVGSSELNWQSYIAALEESPVGIPMGGFVDYSGGKRWGVDSMKLTILDLSTSNPVWNTIRGFESISEIIIK
ncbi:MAG: InlB B-repeat-containing protein [Firmicutes bacterium]|nr:InlB B-repeat-containing protein [Bacillota bacterium]